MMCAKVDQTKKSNFSFGLPGEMSGVEILLPDDDVIDQFIANQKAQSTTYKDKSDLKTFVTFFEKYGEKREVQMIPPSKP